MREVKQMNMLKQLNAAIQYIEANLCVELDLDKVDLYSPLKIFDRKFIAALFLKISRHLSGSTSFVYEIL